MMKRLGQRIRMLELSYGPLLAELTCPSCSDPSLWEKNGTFRVCSPLTGPDGSSLLRCTVCRRLFRAMVTMVDDKCEISGLHVLIAR